MNLRVLSYPNRLNILMLLAGGEQTVSAIAHALDDSWDATKQNLESLSKARFVMRSSRIKDLAYRVNPDTIKITQSQLIIQADSVYLTLELEEQETPLQSDDADRTSRASCAVGRPSQLISG